MKNRIKQLEKKIQEEIWRIQMIDYPTPNTSNELHKMQEQYEFVVSEYVQQFCNKQDVSFEFWVADQIGGIACFGDILYFNFMDIVWDINSKQPKNQIIDWIYESVDNPEKSINYFSYSKGLRWSDLTER